MALSHLPPFVGSFFVELAHWLDKRSAARVPALLLGMLLASGRRTVTSWFRSADLWEDWRQGYVTACACGRHVEHMAITVVHTVEPVLDPKRLLLGIDDTPTARYGPQVEGAGIHHNPTPGPAAQRHVYGHVWVIISALAQHPGWGTIPLPLQAQLYIRATDIDKLPPERKRPFRTKLELAVEQLCWLKPWVDNDFEEHWVATDGAYAKRPFLIPVRKAGWVVVSRLRKDAALWDLPPTQRRPGQRGPMPTYGKSRISLAKRAGQTRGWEQVECVQYGQEVTKTIKTFLATYRPAGGVIRVVLVKEEGGWVPFFCTNPNATAAEVLEAASDRTAMEQMNRDVKEVWGAGQQQVRNVYSNEGCFNLNLWMHTLVEVWAWGKPEEELTDRGKSPWDSQPRRPSHADKRKALQREVLRAEIQEALSGRPTKERIRQLAERLLELAA
jgi:DDE superfamily endonuclease